VELGIKDQVAIVTGAGNGIGAAIAEHLAIEGCRVGVLDRDGAAAESTVRRILDNGGQALALAADVTNSTSVGEAVDTVVGRFGGLQILVNNAGFSMDAPVTAMTDEQWQKVLDVTLTGAFYCTRKAAPFMLARGYGRIINMSSRAHFGDINKANYSAAKAGLIGMTKALSLELAPSGVTVNAIAPGIIETERLRRLPHVTEIEARSKAAMPVKRFGHVDEVAKAVLFLAAASSGFVTGETLHVSGGRYG
jgi:3-oxoacyl-[acyl-carrier protein] reductase